MATWNVSLRIWGDLDKNNSFDTVVTVEASDTDAAQTAAIASNTVTGGPSPTVLSSVEV